MGREMTEHGSMEAQIDPLALVRALKLEIRARAPEIEQARRLPSDLARRMAGSGLFRLYLPRSVGGAESSPLVVMRLVAELAEADASVAWCFNVGVNTGLIAAWLPKHRAKEIFCTPDVITASSFAPTGTGVLNGDHYLVNGRWAWASGAENSSWISGGVLTRDGDSVPQHRLMFFRTEDVQLLDTWHATGLCGTGSLDFAVKDARVPHDLCIPILNQEPVEPGPLYRFPLIALLGAGHACVALGNAKAALEAFRAIAVEKRPQNMGRALAERHTIQAEYARAVAKLASARALLDDTVARAWGQAQRGDAFSIADRAMIRLAATHAVRVSADVAGTAYELGGGSSVYRDSELQRRFRDAHVITQHRGVSQSSLEMIGSVLLDQPTDTMLL